VGQNVYNTVVLGTLRRANLRYGLRIDDVVLPLEDLKRNQTPSSGREPISFICGLAVSGQVALGHADGSNERLLFGE